MSTHKKTPFLRRRLGRRLRALREQAGLNWFRFYDFDDMGDVDVETYAERVAEFPGLNLPGLLQTEAYIRALLQPSKQAARRLANDVPVRLIRQKRLQDSDNALEPVAIVDEAALALC